MCSEASLGPDAVKSQDNRIVTIDAIPAGVSGDKYLGALIDLGGKTSSLERVGRTIVSNLPGTKKVEVQVRKVERGSVGARLVSVTSEEEVEQRKEDSLERLPRNAWKGSVCSTGEGDLSSRR